jgi:hypothetical protein
MKMLIAITFALVSVMMSGCAAFANNNGVSVSGQVSYEYQKSL